MTQNIDITVTAAEAGQRLDKCIAVTSGLSRSAVQQLLLQGNILVNGKLPAKSYILALGDCVSISIPPPADSEVLPQDISLDIVFEDQWLLVVNKPKGMVVHPAAGNPDGTLVNALLHHCAGGLSGIGGEIRPGIVHRIDKDTSGLLVVAKDDFTHQSLSEQFAQHSVQREYQAIVHGHFNQDSGIINAPIGRSNTDRKKMSTRATHAKKAVTHFHVLEEYPGYSYISLKLETGRTHQIRVHMAALGHPVAGDTVYGPNNQNTHLQGQCLHAKTLGFIHPHTKQELCFNSELPDYFTSFLTKLGRKA